MKKIFLTGGSGDIGTGIKSCFEKYGYNVIAPEHSDLNLEDFQSIESYFKNNECNFDIFVHCAGYNCPELIENVTFENIEKAVKINYISFIKIMKYIIPYMKQKLFLHFQLYLH